MIPGPESKRDPGPSITEITIRIPDQQLCLDIVPAPPSTQSFVPDVHLGPHLGPGMFRSHIHLHRLESLLQGLQEMSLPFAGISVLVLRWETAALKQSTPHSASTCWPPRPMPGVMAKEPQLHTGFYCSGPGLGVYSSSTLRMASVDLGLHGLRALRPSQGIGSHEGSTKKQARHGMLAPHRRVPVPAR